jgi:uncharacterized Fe-S radical SAM superfamily protein PflX
MDEWEMILRALASCEVSEQPCEICRDVHEGTCEAEDLGNYNDPQFEANGRYRA